MKALVTGAESPLSPPAKARTFLGFEPQISLALGAKLTFDWYRKENVIDEQ